MGARMVSCDQRDGSPIGQGYYSYSNSVCDSGGQLPPGRVHGIWLHQGWRAHAGKALFAASLSCYDFLLRTSAGSRSDPT
jgi:hypothetical protein